MPTQTRPTRPRSTPPRRRRRTAPVARPEIAALLEAHAAVVHRVALARTGDAEAAAEIAQETFLEAVRSIDRLDPDGDPRAWLLGIARNVSRRHARSRARRAATFTELQVDDVTDRDDAVDLSAVAAERLAAAVGALPPELGAVLALKYDDALSYDAIADVLGIPRSTVQGRLRRAKAILRSELRDLDPTDLDEDARDGGDLR